MKRLHLLIIAILTCQVVHAQAERFRILYLNTPTITIGGKSLAVGNDFGSKDKIKWESDKQAMRIMSLTTDKQYTLTATIISKKNSLDDFLRNKKLLATRPGYPNSLIGVSGELRDTLHILDKIEIRTSVPIDSNHFFYASYIKDGNLINKRLPALKEGGFAFDLTLWDIDGNHHEPYPITISVHYFNTIENKVTDLANDILIIPLNP